MKNVYGLILIFIASNAFSQEIVVPTDYYTLDSESDLKIVQFMYPYYSEYLLSLYEDYEYSIDLLYTSGHIFSIICLKEIDEDVRYKYFYKDFSSMVFVIKFNDYIYECVFHEFLIASNNSYAYNFIHNRNGISIDAHMYFIVNISPPFYDEIDNELQSIEIIGIPNRPFLIFNSINEINMIEEIFKITRELGLK